MRTQLNTLGCQFDWSRVSVSVLMLLCVIVAVSLCHMLFSVLVCVGMSVTDMC